MKNKVAVLVSGGGRSLENLASLQESGELSAELSLVVSNNEDAYALERASRLNIPSLVIDPERALSPEQFSERAFQEISAAGCQLVVLAGFLRFLPIPSGWEGRVLNIHPSLLPAFGGKGYYGDKVHAAVLERGVKYTGCTVHYVDNVYDNGPISIQRMIEVKSDDTIESIGARVFQEEMIALPAAINAHFAHQKS
jgi:formyltetrahydrofolate-dependent phosphoribosylglycinamide formyltransferase